jgi:hypothetical protein
MRMFSEFDVDSIARRRFESYGWQRLDVDFKPAVTHLVSEGLQRRICLGRLDVHEGSVLKVFAVQSTVAAGLVLPDEWSQRTVGDQTAPASGEDPAGWIFDEVL